MASQNLMKELEMNLIFSFVDFFSLIQFFSGSLEVQTHF